MKAPFILAAALAFLAGVPVAQAFQTVQSDQVPAANAPRVADPDDIRDSIVNQGASNGSATSPVGNVFRFGTPFTPGGSLDAPSLFIESPASRTVPSQRQ